MAASHRGRKDLRPILRAIRAAGWVLERCRSGHYKTFPWRSQRPIIFAATSDPRGLANIRADLRRAGLHGI